MTDDKPTTTPNNVVSLDAVRLRAGRDYIKPEAIDHVVSHLLAERCAAIGNSIAYDMFAECIVCRTAPPWKNGRAGRWTDTHDHMLMNWLSLPVGGSLKVNMTMVQQAVVIISQMNAYHPVREYLAALPAWDGQPRADTWLSKCFGADDTPLTRAYASKTLIAAVARVQRPGCKVDTVLVLESRKQGKRKSSTLSALCPVETWFTDSKIDITKPERAGPSTVGKWIVEFAELESLKGKEKTATRAWLSSRIDNYRAAYAHYNQDYPRQFIVIGTTNEDEYLDEVERRFWSVRCKSRSDTKWVEDNRDQLWAESLSRFNSGEEWWLDEDLEEQANESSSKRVRTDASEGMVRDWMQQHSREIDGVTTAEVLIGALGFDKDRVSQGTRLASQILRKLGYEHDQHARVRRMTPHLSQRKDRFWRNPTALIRCEHGKAVPSERCLKCELGLG